MADVRGVGGLVETLKTEVERLKDQLADADALASDEAAKTAQAIEAFSALAQRLEAGGLARHQAVVAAPSPEGRMKPVNLAAKLAAAETELACRSWRSLRSKRTATSCGRSGTTGAGRPRCSAPRS